MNSNSHFKGEGGAMVDSMSASFKTLPGRAHPCGVPCCARRAAGLLVGCAPRSRSRTSGGRCVRGGGGLIQSPSCNPPLAIPLLQSPSCNPLLAIYKCKRASVNTEV